MDKVVNELIKSLSQDLSVYDEEPYARSCVALDLMRSANSFAMPRSFEMLTSYTSKYIEEYRNDVRRAWIAAAKEEVINNVIAPILAINDFVDGSRNDVSEMKTNLAKSTTYLSGNESSVAKDIMMDLQACNSVLSNKASSIESKTPMLSFKKDVKRAPAMLEKVIEGFESEAQESRAMTLKLMDVARGVYKDEYMDSTSGDSSAKGDYSLGEIIKVYCALYGIKSEPLEFDSSNPLHAPDGFVVHPRTLNDNQDHFKEIADLVKLSNDLDRYVVMKQNIVERPLEFAEFLSKIDADLKPIGDDALDRLDRCIGIEFIDSL